MFIEAEKIVVGALLLKPELLQEIDLLPDEFGAESYRLIFSCIIDMVTAGEVVDPVTVAERVGTKNLQDGLSQLVLRASGDHISFANVAAYCEIVRKDARIRAAKAVAADVLNEIETDEDGEVVDRAIKQLMELSQTRKSHDASLRDMMRASVESIDRASENPGPVGVVSGITELDNSLGGFHDSDLIVVAGRPAMGKTAVMINLAHNANRPVGIISSEQPMDQVGGRLISINGKLDSNKLRNGRLPDDDWMKVSEAVATLSKRDNIWINDKPGINILELSRQARKWKHQHDIGLLLVDYIQIIKWLDPRADKRIQVGGVAEALKQLARELGIPVCALSQVNRECENRINKRPMVSDLKEAGEIEQVADEIVLLYRDEVYNPDSPDKGVMELIIGKNRHGPIGTIFAAWIGHSMRVENLYREYGGSHARKRS